METATTSIYKFQDPIENLQIKITLRKQPIIDATLTNPNLASLPLSSSPSLPSSSMVEMKVVEKPRRFKSTSYIFKWQEKIFSKRYTKAIDNTKREKSGMKEKGNEN
jgi:hypothetical protein